MIRIAVFALALSAALPALAQEPASRPACAVTDDSKLPPALAGWRSRAALAAAATPADAGKAALPLGRGIDGQLKRNGEVAFPVLPAKPGGSVSYGGLFEIPIEAAGDYQVSLGTGAWIEVVRDGAAVESTAHAPGPPCASLKKTVVFPLSPGRYLLEISGNAEAVLPLMVHRVK